MLEIPKYKTFEEKSKNFNIIKIDNIDDFEFVYKNLSKFKGIYRGVKSSSYKIYTSKQREFFKNSNNKNYIRVLKENKYLQEYFRLAKIPKTDLSYYSILQHYGKPTPLIDFSFNFSVALFFGMEKISNKKTTSLTELDNYFSLYFISKEDLDIIDVSSLLRNISEYNTKTNEYFQNYEDYSQEKILEGAYGLFYINSRKVYFLYYEDSYSDIVNIYNNQRILMQEGVFIFNDLNQYSLEEALKIFLQEELSESQHSPWDDGDTNRPDIRKALLDIKEYYDNLEKIQNKLQENIITSFEINKSLIKDIRNLISLPEKDYIYFDIEKILEKV